MSHLLHDELRQKTPEFKDRIADFLKDIDDECHPLSTNADAIG